VTHWGNRTSAGRRSSWPARGDTGTSLLEVMVALAIMSCLLGLGLPAIGLGADSRQAGDAAQFLAGQFRLARQRAVMTGRRVAMVFDSGVDGVAWRVCEDVDRDDVSRADIQAGRDRCDGPPQPLGFRFPRVQIAYAAGVPSPDGVFGAAPVRFGQAGMAVFSPAGTSSSGTIGIQGAGRAQFAVRLAGITGRARVLQYDWGRGVWIE